MPTSLTDVSANLPTLGEVAQVLALQAGYNAAIVVLGAALLGAAAGLVGTFALLRKRALMGDALAHSALPGLAAAFLLGSALGVQGKSLPLLLTGATISGVIGVLTVQSLVRYTRLPEDAAIGAVLSVFFGVGIVGLSVIQSLSLGGEGGLHHFIYGQTAAMRSIDAQIALALTLVVIALALLLLKEFRLVCFDAEFARVSGWPVSRIDLLMMGMVVLVTVVGLQAVGLLLIVALLVIPPTSARFWTDRLGPLCGLSAVFGASSGYIGAALSALLPRLPAGAVIVLCAGALFIVSFLFAPQRGLLASALRAIALRIRVTEEHLFRDAYERNEGGSEAGTLVLQQVSSPFLRILIWLRSLHAGYLDREGRLTTTGKQRGRTLTRNHRLWEEYLVTHASALPGHVDLSADLAEHVLSPEVLSEIEASLSARGVACQDPLPSLHPLPQQRHD